MHVYAFISVYGHVSAGFCGSQLSTFPSMELKLQVVVSNLTWLLDAKLWYSAGSVH